MLFSQSDKMRIEQAIENAETRTSGELVVAVVETSSDYGRLRMLVVLMSLMLGTLAALLLHGSIPITWAILVPACCGMLAWSLTEVPALFRFLISNASLDAAVSGRAHQYFSQLGVHQTRERSGILIFLSEFERRVVLLGDRGIHSFVGDRGWQKAVQQLTQGIQGKRATDAVIQCIEHFGDVLAAEFPRRSDDVNELSNRVQELN